MFQHKRGVVVFSWLRRIDKMLFAFQVHIGPVSTSARISSVGICDPREVYPYFLTASHTVAVAMTSMKPELLRSVMKTCSFILINSLAAVGFATSHAQGDAWEHAVLLLEEMRFNGYVPTILVLSAVVAA